MQNALLQELTLSIQFSPINTIWIFSHNIESAEAVFQSCFVKKRDLKKFGKIYSNTSVPEFFLGWRPANLSNKSVFTSVLLRIFQNF